MKILLINVALRPESKVKLFPIGLSYIATAMEIAGFKFDLLDIDAHRYSNDEVDKLIAKEKYDVIAMGCIVTGYSKVKDLCKRIRSIHSKATIIVGNSVATSIYKILLTKTEADIAVMGEGDVTIVELLHALDGSGDVSEVKGIAWKNRMGEVVLNASQPAIRDISNLPHINFDLFDVEIYIENAKESLGEVEDIMNIPRDKLRSLPLNTARGCVGACTFCYHNFKGYRYRYRSMKSVLDEAGEMIRKYNLNYIEFGDELTLFSRNRAEEFANAILSSGLKFYWSITCRADCFAEDSDVEIMKKMKEAGCTSVAYSLESSNADILKMMNKHITVEQFARTTELFRRAGINTQTSLVIGYPIETVDTIKDTFKCCADNKIYPSAGFLLPQPGSVMYDYALEHGFIKDEEDYLLQMGDRQDLRLNMTTMTNEEMETATLEGLSWCNSQLAIGLDSEHLIKTQYYRKAKK